MAVMEKEQIAMKNSNEVPMDVTYFNGSLIVANVPHKKYVELTPDGDYIEYAIRGSVSLRLSAITEYMQENDIAYFDYSDYHKYPEIESKITRYMS
ncbi:hypothetical protein AM501_02405 [Aneurinibacillus migulanus]|uniref:hypothetical protein n=1 Tax=Aneurinibacillus migulanus TaxID=47500 RepID=UPI0005BC9821|nr:hypothetical protein [Aneurinibacillus migulanus]KIV52284.1 hypothetical protein TS64_22705 [Aneurinibacillus migulanus]KPD09728.1 hypothetical protein AM501_02405 [Aneurinibacillus migulanus]